MTRVETVRGFVVDLLGDSEYRIDVSMHESEVVRVEIENVRRSTKQVVIDPVPELDR